MFCKDRETLDERGRQEGVASAAQHQDHRVLSGFDRIVLRATLRQLVHLGGLQSFLIYKHVRLTWRRNSC